MKAIIWTKYGMAEGLLLKDIAVPVPKKRTESISYWWRRKHREYGYSAC
jgi:hypothetical protein